MVLELNSIIPPCLESLNSKHEHFICINYFTNLSSLSILVRITIWSSDRSLRCWSVIRVLSINVNDVFHCIRINFSAIIIVEVLWASWSSFNLMSGDFTTVIFLLNPRSITDTIYYYFVFLLEWFVWVAIAFHLIDI